MKHKIILILIGIIGVTLYCQDFLTIYNDNQALYKTEIKLDLKKGVQFYSFENIPTGIISESVIFLPKN